MPSLVLVLAAVAAFPAYASSYWAYQAMAAIVFAISCLGLLVLVGWAREISLAQAGLTGSALFMTFLLAWDYDTGRRLPTWLAMLLAVAFVVAVSVGTALVAARLAAAYVIVLTLSLQFLLESTVFRAAGCLCHPEIGRPEVLGLSLRQDEYFYYVVVAVLAACVLVLARLRRSRFGRAMILTGADPEAAAVAGICPWRYRVAAFAVAGLFAGVAGVLAAPVHVGLPGDYPYTGWFSFVYLAVPVLAGFDSIGGAVLVALALALIPPVFLEARLNMFLLAGVAMLAGTLLGPRGLGRLVPRRRRPTPVLAVPVAS